MLLILFSTAVYSAGIRANPESDGECRTQFKLKGEWKSPVTDCKTNCIGSMPVRMSVLDCQEFWDQMCKEFCSSSSNQNGHDLDASRSALVESALNIANKFIGTKYLSPGWDTKGIDCSGLVQNAYPDYFGKIDSKTGAGKIRAADQFQRLEERGDESIKVRNLQAGDLVYFHNPDSTDVVHAAIVEMVLLEPEKGYGIIAASASTTQRAVRRQVLASDGTLGSQLIYAGGGRPK